LRFKGTNNNNGDSLYSGFSHPAATQPPLKLKLTVPPSDDEESRRKKERRRHKEEKKAKKRAKKEKRRHEEPGDEDEPKVKKLKIRIGPPEPAAPKIEKLRFRKQDGGDYKPVAATTSEDPELTRSKKKHKKHKRHRSVDEPPPMLLPQQQVPKLKIKFGGSDQPSTSKATAKMSSDKKDSMFGGFKPPFHVDIPGLMGQQMSQVNAPPPILTPTIPKTCSPQFSDESGEFVFK
jgi:hypothetical protein